MTRRFGSGKLKNSSVTQEDVNPMDGLGNLADVMLVFACGLMLALIINWNLDVSGLEDKSVSVQMGDEITDVQEITELEGLAQGEDPELEDGSNYQEKGTVYEDPVTGKLYMVVGDE